MNYCDIHTHILYGLDDGAKDIEQTENLIASAYSTGTRVLFFTPHFNNNKFDSRLFDTNMKSIEPLLEKYQGMQVYGGCEVLYGSYCIDLLENDKIPTLAKSRYMLVEFMNTVKSKDVADAIQNIRICGYVPIIAHIERYFELYGERISRFIEAGALIQANARSVIGKNGLRAKLYCRRLLKKEQIHFIASDSHDMETRTPDLDDCAKYVTKKYGKEYARQILFSNAEKVIKNEII